MAAATILHELPSQWRDASRHRAEPPGPGRRTTSACGPIRDAIEREMDFLDSCALRTLSPISTSFGCILCSCRIRFPAGKGMGALNKYPSNRLIMIYGPNRKSWREAHTITRNPTSKSPPSLKFTPNTYARPRPQPLPPPTTHYPPTKNPVHYTSAPLTLAYPALIALGVS